MQLITCHSGRIQKLLGEHLPQGRAKSFGTGLEELDELAPGHAFARGAIHELLTESKSPLPLTFALILARAAAGVSNSSSTGVSPVSSREPKHGRDARATGAIVWCDSQGQIYPPALAARGIDLKRLFILRTKGADQMWGIAEALRCRGVAAVVAQAGKLSRVEARRLQLAAETGSSAGILLRPAGRVSSTYAAATRWLVESAKGERTVQRWNIQLIHGHGGRVGQSVFLEYSRETNLVRATRELADRAIETQIERISA